MKGVTDLAIVYDIACDKERARVSGALRDYGFRVQRSVFECRLDKRGLRDLLQTLAALQVKSGSIKIYRLEPLNRRLTFGAVQPEACGVSGAHAFII
jgi:CRISPR-associated protein Cas2